jgi:YkoY family integral membrane protein
MFEQTFALSDIPRILTLTFLELLLSADNAIILGLITRPLAPHLRKRALFIGVLSAFFLRAAGLLSASYLLRHSWIQVLGAAYLIYLCLNHFFKRKRDPFVPATPNSFWKTVILVECFDLAFALDSILAGVAFIGPASSPIHPKLWIVYLGGMLGLLGIRYAATVFTKLIEQFPRLETSAYLMVGWIGLKLGVSALGEFPLALLPIFWLGMVLIFFCGLIRKK